MAFRQQQPVVACLTSPPPVFTNLCCKLLSDQWSICRGSTSHRQRFPIVLQDISVVLHLVNEREFHPVAFKLDGHAVWSKYFKCVEGSRSSMMDVEDELNHMRVAFGLRDRFG